jgi:hypothetical protein
MASSKKRTTMAKLAREQKLREKRAEKQARKDARRDASSDARLGGEEEHVAGPGLDPAATLVAPADAESSPESGEGPGGD